MFPGFPLMSLMFFFLTELLYVNLVISLIPGMGKDRIQIPWPPFRSVHGHNEFDSLKDISLFFICFWGLSNSSIIIWQYVRLNPHCLEAVHCTTEFCIFDPYLYYLVSYHTWKLDIHWYWYYFFLALNSGFDGFALSYE